MEQAMSSLRIMSRAECSNCRQTGAHRRLFTRLRTPPAIRAAWQSMAHDFHGSVLHRLLVPTHTFVERRDGAGSLLNDALVFLLGRRGLLVRIRHVRFLVGVLATASGIGPITAC